MVLLAKNGSMATDWLKINNTWYYFNGNGVMTKSASTGPLNFYNDSLLKINKCTASVSNSSTITLSVEASRNSTIENLSNAFYIAMLNSAGNKLLDVSAGKTTKGNTLKISASFSSDDAFKSASMSKYAVVIKRNHAYEVVSTIRFMNNPDCFASAKDSFKGNYWGYYENYKITSKKGIQEVSDSYTEELRVQHILLNVDIQDLVWIRPYSGYVPYRYKGKTYYFSDLQALKKTIYDLHDWGSTEGNAYGEGHTRNVTLVLLMSWKYNSLSYLIHPDARTKGAAPYYSLNTKDEAARDTYEALFCYLGEELGQTKERVNNWTLGNEINSCNAWNYVGNMSFNDYVANYAQAFQLLNQGIKRTAKSPRLFISLDHCWDTANAGYTGKSFLDQFASYMNQAAPSIQWNVNYHPYSQPLTNTEFWTDNSTTSNTSYISMKNIQILTNYLSTLEQKYGKISNSIRVILGEIGFSGTGGNHYSEQAQAAALGYGYYIAMFNKRIDSYIIRAYLDDSSETSSGLYLGLRQKNSKQPAKEAYSVYKNLDTGSSIKTMNSYLKLIGISDWKSTISEFDASKLPAKDF